MLDFSSGTLSRWMEQGYRDVSSRAGEAAAFLEGRVGPPARRTAAGGRAGR
jgi:hypothetical protein